MQQFHQFLVLLFPLIFLPSVISVTEVSAVGGWTPIKDINDPHVVEIAKFAVDEYNKKGNTSLTLVTVVSGETQVISGTNYRLILKATDGTATKTYQAIVWEDALKNKKLTSFEPFLG
ncbi:hypothetical protein V6N13_096962 [Hibiscus sabdariffa]|uniref:Cystatin domain-containing protein n=2 Tax=Hibiscus sabdariffa TaxID=183260 RepID=A0ABR1ZEW4_9ROSI